MLKQSEMTSVALYIGGALVENIDRKRLIKP